MRLPRIFSCLVAVIVLPAIALAQKTTYDYDKTAVFPQFKTYSTKAGTPTGDALIDTRIAASIESQLAAKGLVRNDSAPDVFVLYHVAFDKQKDISTYSNGPVYGGYGWGWGGGWGATTTDVRVREILVGTLAIDIVDARKGQVAWRGLGTREIDTDAKPEKRDQNIAKAVDKIFRNYPPKVKQ